MEKLLLSLLEVKHHFDLVQAKVSGHAVCPSMHNFDQIEAGRFTVLLCITYPIDPDFF